MHTALWSQICVPPFCVREVWVCGRADVAFVYSRGLHRRFQSGGIQDRSDPIALLLVGSVLEPHSKSDPVSSQGICALPNLIAAGVRQSC